MKFKHIERKLNAKGTRQIDRYQMGNYKILISTDIENEINDIWSITITPISREYPYISVEDLRDFDTESCRWVGEFDFTISKPRICGSMTIEETKDLIEKYQEALKVVEFVKNTFC